MKIIDRAAEWLKKEGYVPQMEEGFLVVKYQGLTYLIPDTEDDETFLKVDIAFPLEEYKQHSRDKVLKLCNLTSQDIKVAKATLRDDALVFSAEVFVFDDEKFGEVLLRLFAILQLAGQYFFDKSQEK